MEVEEIKKKEGEGGEDFVWSVGLHINKTLLCVKV
jgi:hypothetical protein